MVKSLTLFDGNLFVFLVFVTIAFLTSFDGTVTEIFDDYLNDSVR